MKSVRTRLTRSAIDSAETDARNLYGNSMIPKECKRLAEVDFPVAEVSRHAAREKSIRHGHPSTLHLWWARRPLASSRAVLLALLLPDPCDEHCPEPFKQQAREILSEVRQPPMGDEELRKALLWFIGSFANWDMADNTTYLRVGRNLVKAAHGDEPPLVVDPFAGGGSIPLEALRLDCEAFASDLNPVACLILKVMLDDIPRHGPRNIEELRSAGGAIIRQAERELVDLYPKDDDGGVPIAYLWARTVQCEAPNCGAEIPIYRSPWLSKKGATRARFFRETAHGNCRAMLISEKPKGGPVAFRIARGEGSENSKTGFVELTGTKAKGNNANVICPCCGTVLPGTKNNPRVPIQLSGQRGGADVVFDEKGRRVAGARLLAVVIVKAGKKGRHYRLPTAKDYVAVRRAQTVLTGMLQAWERSGQQGLCPVPDEPLPPIGTLGFRVQRYGMREWSDLFTARQKLALIALTGAIASMRVSGDELYGQLVDTLSCGVGKRADYGSSGTKWHLTFEKTTCTFGRQAIPMTWDFVEPIPLGDSSGAFGAGFASVYSAVETISHISQTTAQVQQVDATDHPLPHKSAAIWFTDPPYYDAVPYADLSDFFLVWLKRALPNHSLLRDPFDSRNSLSPKGAEAVQDESKQADGVPKDRQWFEETMARAFAEGRRVLHEDGIGSVVFAHKTTEGWEALLSGIIRGGWTITGSWPVATERGARLRAQDSAALATSVHLICRPRLDDAPVGDWGDVLNELPGRVADWMERLQNEGIRGADLVFACVGPALELFSRYRSVETAEGHEVQLAEYLEKVWEVVGRAALEQVLGSTEAQARNGLVGALEEDARLTALFLWTLQATTGGETPEQDTGSGEGASADDSDGEEVPSGKAKGFSLVFDVVRRFAQPLGIDLPKWEKRTIETKKGVVRLLPVTERAKQLFGEQGAEVVAGWLEQEGSTAAKSFQGVLFPDQQEGKSFVVSEPAAQYGDVSDRHDAKALGATTLDRVHTGMLLQASGRSNALRALLKAEQERGQEFLRLSNALSALYPRGSDEKRLLDAMLLAVPR